MKINIESIIDELKQLETFDLKTYNTYIDKYSKETMLKVLNMMLTDNEDVEFVLNKYFDAYFTIELENMEINSNTYLKLTNKYGEDKVEKYFINLLKVSNNPTEIKEKYNQIYFYIDTINSSQKKEIFDTKTFDTKNINIEDHVKLYIKEIGEYPLLTTEEERTILSTLNYSREHLEIAYCDEKDNLHLLDLNKMINSIRTKDQFKKFKKISKCLDLSSENDEELVKIYIDEMLKLFKKCESIEINDKNAYEESYLNEQLDVMIDFYTSREKLIKANLRLVIYIAKYYVHCGIEILDLISEGNIGLMKAIKKFDITRNTKLSTYATWWIRQSITRCIANHGRTIRLPIHYNEKIIKYNQVLKRLKLEYGTTIPSVEAIAEELGYTVDEVVDIQTVIHCNNYIYLDGHAGEEIDNTIGDIIPDDINIEEIVEKKLLKQIFEECFHILTEREVEVIKYRFGFVDGKIYKLEEIGKKIGITRERVRQIENKAIKKLKHKSKNLRDYA